MTSRDEALERTLLALDTARRYRFTALNCVDSTNAYLKARALTNTAREWDVVIAREQTAGRGRLGRSFFSPGTGLYMSVLIKPSASKNASAAPKLLTAAAAVAAARAVDKLIASRGGDRSAQIKWVNDIYVDGKKVSGILAEGVIKGDSLDSVVLGIGVNVFAPTDGFPKDIEDKASYLLSCVKDRDAVLSELALAFLNEISSICERLDARQYLDEYRSRSCLIGKLVEFERLGERIIARVVGIDDEAALVVELEGGGRLSLFAGEVSVKQV